MVAAPVSRPAAPVFRARLASLPRSFTVVLCYNEENGGEMPQKEAAEMNGDALLFFDGKPEELALYEALEEHIFFAN